MNIINKNIKKLAVCLLTVLSLCVFVSKPTMAAIKDFPSDITMNRVQVYPANVDTKVYYTSEYAYSYGTGSQWLNITLDSRTASLYKQKNCNGFYVKVSAVNTSSAIRYEIFDGSKSIGSGRCTSIPNAVETFGFFVTNDKYNYINNVSYGTWKIIFYGYSKGFPINGNVYLPE